MQAVLDEFHANMLHVKGLRGLYGALRAQTTTALDLSELLRMQLVMCVSALDRYVHELVRAGMIEIYMGSRAATAHYQKYQVGLGNIPAVTSASNVAWLDFEIRTKHSFFSFQQPDKVADAVRIIATVKLWDEVASALGRTPGDVKIQLDLLVSRRNKIAHEFDVDPSSPGARWPITEVMVDEAIAFTEHVCEAIHNVI